MQEFKVEEIAQHDNLEDAWIVYDGNVYDISDYLEEQSHPGGTILLEEYLGKDITAVFTKASLHEHSADAFKLLEFYKIGTLVVNA